MSRSTGQDSSFSRSLAAETSASIVFPHFPSANTPQPSRLRLDSPSPPPPPMGLFLLISCFCVQRPEAVPSARKRQRFPPPSLPWKKKSFRILRNRARCPEPVRTRPTHRDLSPLPFACIAAPRATAPRTVHLIGCQPSGCQVALTEGAFDESPTQAVVYLR